MSLASIPPSISTSLVRRALQYFKWASAEVRHNAAGLFVQAGGVLFFEYLPTSGIMQLASVQPW